jgi:hypothetical protein
MANNVFANGNAVSCKAGNGKVIASFPDVCLSPPSPPAGPVPVPYPVTSFSSDTKGGSKKVKVGGKEVMLKDSSYFKKCTGDEAATKSLGMGVVSHNIGGKVYFAAWSMDVKIEGENVCRHLDITTSNHMSPNGNTPPVPPELEKMTLPDNMKACECKYKRKKHAQGTPKGGDKPLKQTPTAAQKNSVQGGPCWRPNCKTPDTGPFIADHQPSLVERWYKGGCNDSSFGDNSVSTPGEPPGNKEYQELKPRCRGCYNKAYSNMGLSSPSGKFVKEGSLESAKSKAFQKMTREKFNVTPKDC